jgi:hypothetical protein
VSVEPVTGKPGLAERRDATERVHGSVELVGVWIGAAACTLAVLVTYSWVEPAELYHVDRAGNLEGGLSRTLTFLNFPVALLAVALATLAAILLRRRWATAGAALVAATAAFVPFVVDQDDLDARPLNAVPALGVAVALVLTIVALQASTLRGAGGALAGDRMRIVLALLLLVVAVPWYFAELGFYAPDPMLADEPTPDEPIAAVHLGSHHGTVGVLLALSALALSRILPRLGRSRLVAAVSAYVALMLVYGVANAVEDGWHEQVVKRGTTDVKIPSVLLPGATVSWGLILLAAAAVEVLWFRRERREPNGRRPR